MELKTLEKKLNSLPEELQREVLDFIDFLVYKYKTKKKLSFSWTGGLKHLKDRYTSLELEKEIMNEWIKTSTD